MKKIFKKKNKLLKIIATFALLLFIVFYACEKDFFEDPLTSVDAPRAIENAKAWYETNKPEEIILRSFGGNGQMKMKAEWSHAFATRYDTLEVVETDIMSMGMILFLDKECVEKYNETNDPKYKQCYTRMVFKTNRKTGETVGFLMTVVPNLDWLEKSKFKPFPDVTYLFRSKKFGGLILFHHIDGSFSNGWKYEKGKLVGEISSMDVDFNQIPLRDTYCNSYPIYQNYILCADFYISFSEDKEPEYDNTACISETRIIGYYQDCYTIDWGGDPPPGEAGYPGSSGGGTTSNTTTTTTPTTPKTPATRTDCDQSNSAANSTKANTALNANSANVGGNVQSLISQLSGYATNQSNEYGLSVQYASDTYYAWNFTGDSNNQQFFSSGTPNSVSVYTSSNTYLVAHTHPKGANPAPSPLDAMMLADAYKNKDAKNIAANVEFGYGGSQYMVYVDNRSTFAAFCNNPNNSQTIAYNNPNAMFNPGSQLATDYQNAYTSLYNNGKGFSDNDAQSYALSYALDKNNTGLKVYKNVNGTFKEQKTDTSVSGTNTTYSPKICP